MEQLYTSKEVSELLNISRKTVTARSERLKLNHIGRKFLFDESDFLAIKNYKRVNASKVKPKEEQKISTKMFHGIIKTTETFYIYESAMNTNNQKTVI